MKNFKLPATGLFILSAGLFFSQGPMSIDLKAEVIHTNIQVVNREMSPIHEGSYTGIRLSKAYGEGIAWLKDIEFSNGTIEFDVRGEDIKQHSFVGLAFHGKNDSTFDAIYLRPFQFKAEDEISRNKAIQYISLPEFTWRKLRAESPGKYENRIDPSPDPNSWVKVRLVINGPRISVYINGSKTPSLEVEKVTQVNSGSVGFYVADTSGGDFANLSITQAD